MLIFSPDFAIVLKFTVLYIELGICDQICTVPFCCLMNNFFLPVSGKGGALLLWYVLNSFLNIYMFTSIQHMTRTSLRQ